MLNKIIKNLRWKFKTSRFKSCGSNCRVGLDFSVHGEQYICMGNNFRGGKHIIIDAIDSYNGEDTGYTPQIEIGNDVTFTDNCYISCINKIKIADGVLLGSNTFITDNYHGKSTKEELQIPPSRRELFSKGKVTIGKNVWIGRNVCILPDVTIGDGSVIGANSVVTHDVPSLTIVAGAPAKVIKKIE